MRTEINPWRLIFLHLRRELRFTRKQMSEALSTTKDRIEDGAIRSIPTSQATLTRLINGGQVEVGVIERDLLWAMLVEYDVTGGHEDLASLMHALSIDSTLQEASPNRAHKKVKGSSKISWSNHEYIFGVWQTINLSTFVEPNAPIERQNEAKEVRLGIRIIGPHSEASPDRHRLRVCEIGPSTRWDGSADVHDGHMYTRLREISGGRHNGERIFATIKTPTTYNHIATKFDHNFIAVGLTQVMVRNSKHVPAHIFTGICIMRYMPELSAIFLKNRNDSDYEEFFDEGEWIRINYCERQEVEKFLQKLNEEQNIALSKYLNMKSYLDMIRNPEEHFRIMRVTSGSTAYFF